MSLYVILAIIALTVRHTSGQHLYGNCTADQVKTFSNSLPSDCSSNFAKASNPNTVSQVNFDVYCTKTCVGSAQSFARYNCSDSLLAQILEIECYKDTGSFGDHCLLVLYSHQSDERSIFGDVAKYCLTPGTCSANCSAALKTITTDLGCCFESYFNNSPLMDGLVSNGTITVQQRKFFESIGDPTLWSKCNVPELSPCSKQFLKT